LKFFPPNDQRDRGPDIVNGPGAKTGRYSVAFVAVNAEQAEDWNGASGRHFIEQRERHERMLGRLTAPFRRSCAAGG
jgi:hypothetical protein